MKALTLTQPWATLVAIGAKRIETRSWRALYRGPLAIHASKAFPEEARELCWEPAFRAAIEPTGDYIDYTRYSDLTPDDMEHYYAMPRGVIVAVVDLVDCVPTTDLAVEEPERSFGNYEPGRWAWLLTNLRRMPDGKAIPARGFQHLWTPTPDVLRAIEAQL